MRSRLKARVCSAAAGDGVGIEKAGYRDASGECLKSVYGGIVESGRTGKAIVAGTLQQDERGLGESAIGNDGLADHGRLPVEVLNAAACKIEPGIGLQLLTRMALADLASLFDGELIFKGEKDHADGGDDLAHDDDANGPDTVRRVEERESFG